MRSITIVGMLPRQIAEVQRRVGREVYLRHVPGDNSAMTFRPGEVVILCTKFIKHRVNHQAQHYLAQVHLVHGGIGRVTAAVLKELSAP